MFKHEKKRSVFFYFVCYNLIILTIPLTLNILWYSQSSKLVEKNIIENSDTLLHQSQRVIDERLRQVRNMAINIASESDVRRYSNQTDSKSPDSIYINYLVDRLLGKYTSTESFIDTMFVYYNNSEVILSNQDNSRSPHNFFKYHAALFGGAEKTWLKYLHGSRSNIFFNNDNGQNGAIIYMLNVPVGNLDDSSDKLGICLNRSFVSDVFSSASLPNSALRFIVDSNQNILYSDGNQKLCRLFDQGEASRYSNRVVKGGNTKFMVSYITSDETDWRYVCITP
ncbi:MAG: cache domain-containing protein, partial [Clostridia bacterium]|nr:cache domain-containing protein [Clostridia bacterium]